MRLFVLLSRVPYPLEKGDKLRAYHQIKLLSQRHEVYLFCLNDQTVTEPTLAHLRTIAKHVEVVNLSKVIMAFRLCRALFSREPFQVHYFYQNSIQRLINQRLREFNPEHIYCQLIRCAEYVKNFHGCPKTLDYMDAFNAGHRRRIDSADRWFKPFVKEESRRLVTYENLIFDYFEHHTIISAQDQQLIYHENRNKIQVIGNGVDVNFFHRNENSSHRFDLLFTGNMSYPPNVDAACRLAQEILPLVRKEIPSARLLIAGASPAKSVEQLSSINGVEVSGWLPDIRDAYNNASIFVAPMRIGSGMQNKILEAMSMEMPCVTTALVANAFPIDHRRWFDIAESNEDIAAAIIHLHQNETMRKQKANGGRELVKDYYSWESTVEQLNTLLQS
ncbi:MAG: glycosyltransferase [Flavobacteriales bacterium]